MIDPKQITAVLVTKRTDPETIRAVIEPLKIFHDVTIWDNSVDPDRKIFGRYLMAQSWLNSDYIYTQDDDCVIDAARLCEEYQPGELLCNVLPAHQTYYAPTGISLVGWGSIFPRSMVRFEPYLAKYPGDELFDRECDRIFTYLNRATTRVVDIGVQHLPHAYGQDRMGTEARHGADLLEIRARLATL